MSADDSIRDYLTYLADPTSMVDKDEIARLEKAVQNAPSPIDKLRAIAGLDRARNVDGSTFRQGFVENAYEWGQDNDVPASVFRQMGVPEDALRDAGFDVGAKRVVKSRATRGIRARSVSTAEIESWVLDRREPFTIADVSNQCGGSSVTVRKVLDDLIASGKVANLGQAPDWHQRGRVPNLYSLAG